MPRYYPPSAAQASSGYFPLYIVSYLVTSLLLKPTDATPERPYPSFCTIMSAVCRLFYYYAGTKYSRCHWAIAGGAGALIVVEFVQLYQGLTGPKPWRRARGALPSASAAATRPYSSSRDEERSILDLRLVDFWAWTDLPSFALLILFFVVALLMATGCFLPAPPPLFLFLLALAATLFECTLSFMRLMAVMDMEFVPQPSYPGLAAAVCSTLLLFLYKQPSLFGAASIISTVVEGVVVIAGLFPGAPSVQRPTGNRRGGGGLLIFNGGSGEGGATSPAFPGKSV